MSNIDIMDDVPTKIFDPEISTFDTIYDATADTDYDDDNDDAFSSTKADILDFYNQQKKGSKCCGCCCDHRRAVVIVNLISIVLGFIALISYARANAELREASDLDDPDLLAIGMAANQTAFTFTTIGLLASCVAVVGALRFNVYLIGFKIVWTLVNYFVTVVSITRSYHEIEEHYDGEGDISAPKGQFFIHAIRAIFYIYPHVIFIKEGRANIMSRETYIREEYSCCCTRRRHRFGIENDMMD